MPLAYSAEIVVDRPLEETVAIFDSTENMLQWMEGLESFTHMSGTPGKVGAKSKLVVRDGKRVIEMIETITVRDLPHTFGGTYEADGVLNENTFRFSAASAGSTKVVAEQVFHLRGGIKLLGWLFPGAFKKQTMKYMVAFKEFAEKQPPQVS